MKTTLLIKIDPRDPNLQQLREIAHAIREGKIVAFPTETVYGMGGPMSAPGLEDRLIQIKKRDENKPFSYHIGSWEMLDFLKVRRTQNFRFLSRQFWPGPLTILAFNEANEKIGIRFPRSRLAAALINFSGEPFIATSANLSDAGSPRTAEEVLKQLEGQIDYLIDGGRTEAGEDSTVVDLTLDPPVIVRRGAMIEQVGEAVERMKMGKVPRKTILIVCTGNSCRSPMAAGWLLRELEQKGLGGEIEVKSCGIGARNGSPATPEAIFVMKNRAVDIAGHRSRICTREDVMDADLILAMSYEHYTFIAGLAPAVKDKIKVLNVPDPIGLGMMIYEDVIRSIEKRLKEDWDQIIS